MRADRLLSLMALLQTRGTTTAQALADALEVSERTIYRDVDALCAAGVPVYTDRGPGGGIGLLEEYRTNLTGLSPEEARALFMLSIPAPLLQLGVGKDLKAALLKLSAALPETRRQEQQSARQRIHLDARWWGQNAQTGPHLGAVQQALWQDHRLRLLTRTVFGAEIDQEVAPLGLVAKAGEWYLVALRGGKPSYGMGTQVYRVRELLHAESLPETFSRPEDFDLPDFWEQYCRQEEAARGLYWVTARISPGLAGELRWRLGDQAAAVLADAGAPDARGWRVVRIPFDSLEQARERILGYGGAAEVLEPLPLRRSLIDYAEQVAQVYR